MNKIYSVFCALMLVFGLSTTTQAADYFIDGDFSTFPDIEPIAVPSTFAVGNDTSGGDLSLAGGSVLDYWNFTVAAPASYGSLVGSLGLNGSGFSSFATALETFVTGDGGGWTQIAAGVTLGFGTIWTSILEFSPLSPDPTAYRLSWRASGVSGGRES